ncbi:MAG: ATP-grasp domain-containing protein [Candidatus Electrothrix scaldis]|nr:MAG: ATP-grasp domain-containing protein [Candidatus Electrothrix sp. GW3-3]
MKKKLFIAGGGYAEIPLIQAGQQLGYHVITSGNRIHDIGHRYADEYHLADFSDKEAIYTLAKMLEIDALCACCNDFSALSCAYAAEKLGLPGHDPYGTALIIHHKDRFREFAWKHCIPSPKAMGFHSVADALNSINTWRFPLIVKPVDLSGGKGMTKLTTPHQAELALEYALNCSRSKRIVVEEFIEGTRHGFSAFVRNGRIVFYFSDNEHYYQNPYLVSAASTPSIVPKSVEKTLCVESEKIAQLLHLTDGIFHVQYILRDTEPVILEITRRAPGDLYIQLVQHATGVDYPSYIIKASAGLDISDLAQAEPTGFFTRHCMMAAQEGLVKNFRFNTCIKDKIVESIIWGKVGDRVTDVMTSKFGILFLKFDSMHEMLEKTEQMQELICVTTE